VVLVMAVLLSLAILSYAIGLACGMNPSTPSDWVLNLPGVEHEPALAAEVPTLVVLEHGLWRSAASLGRLERGLADHGYDVLNVSYSSTSARIEQHAEQLARELQRRLRECPYPPARIAFVGHSMGGLVIRSYLQRPDAVIPWATVFIATPHRGAILAERRRSTMLFSVLMGDRSALQLAPDDPFWATLGAVRCPRIGVILGARGDAEGWNDDIPGDDDGTVGVDEARLEEATDTIALRVGHTRIGFAAETVHQVLAFLRTGAFAR
jgi:pimeloyl-ACP methyl ester carboxylesterase